MLSLEPKYNLSLDITFAILVLHLTLTTILFLYTLCVDSDAGL